MIKTFEHPELGPITIARRKGTKHLRLSVSGGKVRLGVPFGVSESIALKFLESKKVWLKKHITDEVLLKNGDRIGRAHRLHLEPYETRKVSARINQQTVHVRYPRNMESSSTEVQQSATRGSKKAIQTEAERLLPQRLKDISSQIGLSYTSVKIKFMKSRWGHCTNHGEITLNAYLIQLDWKLIDYVIVHELAHTIHHNHGDKFWELVGIHIPNHKTLRKALKSKQTSLMPNSFDN